MHVVGMTTGQAHHTRIPARRAVFSGSGTLPALIALPGIVALIAEPLFWLVRTWTDPSYQSEGALVAAVAIALVLRSVASGPAAPDPAARRRAWSRHRGGISFGPWNRVRAEW